MKRLLVHGGRAIGSPSRSAVGDPSVLPALGNSVLLPRYHSTEKHDDSDTLCKIGEKERTTAEEFLKMAKEKTDDFTQGAKETVQETKEAVLGESDDDKDKFK
ncbi:uncharacterized protein LOC119281291 isoform X1 [Triticum dicoccoides]|uniref:uncharacterized protein LOC119281291 isoform X1 n=1 Tax=Triticum dicoccoides TaxID=85692 RepID=UPI000E7BB5CC|nr:uncharacterized protein LOC119281291 isoform X1 [Triticum dicoccoides]